MSVRIAESVRRIFVGNLPWTIGKHELKNHFEQFGPVIASQVIFNKTTGLSRGYGFIRFVNQDSLNAALAFEKHQLEGYEIDVRISEGDRIPS